MQIRHYVSVIHKLPFRTTFINRTVIGQHQGEGSTTAVRGLRQPKGVFFHIQHCLRDLR